MNFTNQVTSLDPTCVADFATTMRGAVIQPTDAAYAEACKLYNGMIDKHPALIVLPKEFPAA